MSPKVQFFTQASGSGANSNSAQGGINTRIGLRINKTVRLR